MYEVWSIVNSTPHIGIVPPLTPFFWTASTGYPLANSPSNQTHPLPAIRSYNLYVYMLSMYVRCTTTWEVPDSRFQIPVYIVMPAVVVHVTPSTPLYISPGHLSYPNTYTRHINLTWPFVNRDWEDREKCCYSGTLGRTRSSTWEYS